MINYNFERGLVALLIIGFVFVTAINFTNRETYVEHNKSDSSRYLPPSTFTYDHSVDDVVRFARNGVVTCSEQMIKTYINIEISDNAQVYIPEETIEYAGLDVPSNNDFYAYMDYRCISAGDQYQLQQQAYTDNQGIRRVGDDVCVAMGSYYGTKIGTRFRITTDTGNVYTAVLADCKSDYHTDVNNQYRLSGNGKKNIIEFVVDTYQLDSQVTLMGNVGVYENFGGEIIKIERIEE